MQEKNNKKRKFWISTISEFIIVILGILVALQINNWNQERKNKKLEITLLNEFLVNLEGDLKDVKFNIAYLGKILNSGEIILTHFEEGKPYHDSLKYHLGLLANGTIFGRNLSTYESLKSVGIALISNDNIRKQITFLYSARYAFIDKLENFQHDLMSNLLFPVLSETLIMNGSDGTAIPLNPEKISKNNSFMECIKLNNYYINIQIISYKDLKNLILKLMGDIKTELGYDDKNQSL